MNLETILRERFGLKAFRPGQAEAIGALLDGRDVLGVMPTGAGKSLIYQLAAAALPGLTIVVSPLLALMRDQVAGLEARSIGVAFVDSTLPAHEARAELDAAASGDVKLLYVTPERWSNAAFVRRMREIDVSLFVVDEAHCISDWGHSFRPSYLTLPGAIEAVGRPPVLAVTATATPWIREEIAARLGLRRPLVLVHGFDRPNLFLEARHVEYEQDDQRVLRELLDAAPPETPADEPPIAARLREVMQGSGIIYTATTAAARETAGWLRGWGISADYYHGQRRTHERLRAQRAFMDGSVRVLVATNAFGLGIDKPDVRFVIHRDVPGSVEAYYQEAGRAGRDGELARCILIYRPADLSRAAFLSGGGRLTREEVLRAHGALAQRGTTTLRRLHHDTGLGLADLARLVGILKRARIVSERRGSIRLLEPDWDPEQLSLSDEERRLNYERSRRDMMRGYAESSGCRRRFVLNYFGEDYAPHSCDMCDNDVFETADRVVIEQLKPVETAFHIGQQVLHRSLGAGVVQGIDDTSLTVLFDEYGYKTLATDVVQQEGLLVKR